MIDKLRYDCLKSINYSVYSNDLCGDTLQDLLSNMVATINLTVDDVNHYSVIVNNLVDYVKGEGLSIEVQKQLNIWLEDGTIDRIINQEIFGDLEQRMINLNKKLDDYKVELNAKFDAYKEEINLTLQNTVTSVEEKIQEMVTKIESITNVLIEKVDKIKLQLPVNMIEKGCDNTGLNDCSDIIINVISEMVRTKKCRELFFPAGTYKVSKQISLDMNYIRLQIKGEGHGEETSEITKIVSEVNGDLFNLTTCREVVIKDLAIYGREGTDVAFIEGRNCFNIQGTLILEGCHINGFDNISTWKGGYYHKYDNCYFNWFNVGFKDYPSYNLNFSLCKFHNFKTCLTSNGGNGAITFNQCSFERFKSPMISALSSVKGNINLIGCYIENYPNKTSRPPFSIDKQTSGAYDNSRLIVGGFGSITLIGNAIITNGIQRVISVTGDSTNNITSIGNNIYYTKKDGTAFDIYCSHDNKVKTMTMRDVAFPVSVDDIGSKLIRYVTKITPNNGYSVPGSIDIYNPFDKKTIVSFLGNTSSRPTTNLNDGVTYYDTSIKKQLYWNSTDNRWYDAMGNQV